MAAHSTIVRSTLAPVPSGGSGRGSGHGWRRLAGISTGDGVGKDAQAVRAEAHRSGSSRIGDEDTLDLPGDGAALCRDLGALGLVPGRRAVHAAALQALGLGVGFCAPAVGRFPARALPGPGGSEAGRRGNHHGAGQQLHAAATSAQAMPYSHAHVCRCGLPGRQVRM